jgi:hypothetical protein
LDILLPWIAFDPLRSLCFYADIIYTILVRRGDPFFAEAPASPNPRETRAALPLTTANHHPASLPRHRRKDPSEARATPCDGDSGVLSLRRCSSPPPARASMASMASTTGLGGHASILHVRLLRYPRTSSSAAGPSPREALDPGGPSRIWWFAWKGVCCLVWCIRGRRTMQWRPVACGGLGCVSCGLGRRRATASGDGELRPRAAASCELGRWRAYCVRAGGDRMSAGWCWWSGGESL